MPHAIRVYRQLRALAFTEEQSLAVAAVFERAKTDGASFQRETLVDALCDAGIKEELADCLVNVARTTFPSERFRCNFLRVPLKTALVRGGLKAADADALLDAIEPCVIALKTKESRLPVSHTPGPGRVVMCDFRFLKVPEMQKERRAIIISSRQTKDQGRCTVVPVSMSIPRPGETCNLEFKAGAYPFFHPDNPVWALCDHVYTVSLTRLWQVNVASKPTIMPISAADLDAVRKLVATNLGS